MWKGPTYDCQQCGACCTNQDFIPASGYVNLSRDESKEMKRLGLSVVQADGSFFLGTRARADSNHPVCVGLHGRVGGICSCVVYDCRPYNCRQFEVGSLLCKSARKEAGLPL